jgi:hypothetical protein
MKKFSCKINGPSWGGQFTSIWNLSQSETRIVKVMFLSLKSKRRIFEEDLTNINGFKLSHLDFYFRGDFF